MKIKSLLLFICLLCMFMLVGCNSAVPFSDYEKNLEANGLNVTNMSDDEIKDLVNEFLGDIPDIALPNNIMIAGSFSEKVDVNAYMDGTKEFDAEKFSDEFEGVIIDFGLSIKATLVMDYEDDVRAALEDEGIILDEDLKFLQKGSYIYIGYPEFIKNTYEYTPE